MSDVSDTAERSPDTLGGANGPAARGPSPLNTATAMFLKQREASILLIAVVMFIYFATTTHAFFSHGSFVNIAQYMAPYVIIGIGLVLLMVCGEIDLSVGFVWLLAPYVDALLRRLRPAHVPGHRGHGAAAVGRRGSSTASSPPCSASRR